MTARNEPDGAGQQAAEKPSPKPESGSQARGSGGLDLSDKVDQVGMILSKGLDLAEAGVSLGVTIVNRIGSAAQQQVLERMDRQMARMDRARHRRLLLRGGQRGCGVVSGPCGGGRGRAAARSASGG